MSHSSLPALTPNAATVLEARYLLRDERGDVVESPAELFRRVARHVAEVEVRHGGDAPEMEARFFEAMASLEFLPSSPTLMNAGTRLGQLAACFVLPIEDSLDSIFASLRDAALIHQTGGGVGYDFSRIRPAGDVVASTGGAASGPLSFLRVFDAACEAIRQGGRRRGANMGVLSVDHPDVEAFIRAKRGGESLRNFNLSLATPARFLEAASGDGGWDLVNPRTGATVARRDASGLLELAAECAWEGGDPGLVLVDRINRDNPTPELGPITATNPCGEVPLLPYEACVLGSINVARLVRSSDFDWERLAELVELAVRFLDDCLDASVFPLPRIAEVVRRTRKIGLGLMGFADALVALRVPYASGAAEDRARRLMAFVSERALSASRSLAAERGPFPAFARSRLAAEGEPPVRNATRTAIAPTGTLSLIAGCSPGIEPRHALVTERHVLDGRTLVDVSPLFEEAARESGCWTTDVQHAVRHEGSVATVAAVPPGLRELFRTAQEIPAEWHLRLQAAFQQHVDNAVSKTVSLPGTATVADVREVYEHAFALDLKGITVYREGSRAGQVLTRPSAASPSCPDCGAILQHLESSSSCGSCGYSTP